jgi:hypothetical protein
LFLSFSPELLSNQDDEEPKDLLIATTSQQEIAVLPSWLPSIPTAMASVALVAALCGMGALRPVSHLISHSESTGIFFKVFALVSLPQVSHASKRFSRLFGARR